MEEFPIILVLYILEDFFKLMNDQREYNNFIKRTCQPEEFLTALQFQVQCIPLVLNCIIYSDDFISTNWRIVHVDDE